MTPEQAAAYIFAQSVAALAAIEGMKAANREREHQGYALAYDEAAFVAVQIDYCIMPSEIKRLFESSKS